MKLIYPPPSNNTELSEDLYPFKNKTVLIEIISYKIQSHRHTERLRLQEPQILSSSNPFAFHDLCNQAVWVGRDLYVHLVPTPCCRQRLLPLYQVAQNSLLPGLEYFQGKAYTVWLLGLKHAKKNVIYNGKAYYSQQFGFSIRSCQMGSQAEAGLSQSHVHGGCQQWGWAHTPTCFQVCMYIYPW